MARGNQRDKAREKNAKAAASVVSTMNLPSILETNSFTERQKRRMLRSEHGENSYITHNSQMSGTEFAREKDNVAAIMRAKQAAGMSTITSMYDHN